MKNRFICLAGGILLSTVSLVPVYAGQASQQTAPDNTKVNKAPGATADQAKNSLPDREVMRQIRRSVMKDKSLSTYGHNVKIVSQHGKVTLRGPVHSDDEKMTIEKYAQKVAGDGNVTSELTVKPESK